MPLTGERKLEYMRRRHVLNRDRLNANSKRYYEANKETALSKSKAYNKENPLVNKAAVRRYQAKKQADPAWRAEQTAKSKAWRDANPERSRENHRNNYRHKYETDPVFVIKNRLRARLQKKLKCQKAHKATDTLALTGCSGEFLRGYLEAMFQPGMTWNNTHIDHIVPCAAFDLRDPDQQRLCFHYSNLQVLFGVDNMSKGSKCPRVIHG